MKIQIDKSANAAYIYLINEEDYKQHSIKPLTVNENIVLDFTEEGKLFGIEILSLKILDVEKFKDSEIEYLS